MFAAGGTKRLQAAPLTFRFNAEIQTVFPGNPFESGINFATGDVIAGTFTFEPNPGDGSNPVVALQTNGFQLRINGVAIASPNYEIESFNDYSIEDFPDATTIDTLELDGAGLTSVESSAGLNLDPLQSTFRIDLWSPADVLDQAQIPSDVAIWNEFNLWRSLQVILRDGEGGTIGFAATVEQFSAIPEPSGLLLALSAMVTLLVLATVAPRLRSRSKKRDVGRRRNRTFGRRLGWVKGDGLKGTFYLFRKESRMSPFPSPAMTTAACGTTR
jgi:hypothetical protein